MAAESLIAALDNLRKIQEAAVRAGKDVQAAKDAAAAAAPSPIPPAAPASR